MNKLSCMTLAAVVGGLTTCAAFGASVQPMTPQVIPNDNAPYYGMSVADIDSGPSKYEGLVRTGADLGEAVNSREFAAARTAVGDSYAFTLIGLANDPFTDPGNVAGYVPITGPVGSAPAEPQDPNFTDPDMDPFSGDETGDSPAAQFLFNFDASTGFDAGEGRAQAGRGITYVDLFVVEFETNLPNGNVFIQASYYADDPLHGGDIFDGLVFLVEDPADPANVVESPVTLPRLDLGNNAFGDPADFPEEGDPGWEDNMLQHGIVGGLADDPATADLEGIVEFGFQSIKPGVALFAGGGSPSTLFFSPNTAPDEFLKSAGAAPGSRDDINGNGIRGEAAALESDPNDELTAFLGYGFPGGDGAFGTSDDIPIGGYGIQQLNFIWELDPANAPTTPGACCAGGAPFATTLNDCLAQNGTFFGVGSDPADITACPDCVVPFDSAAADEASTFGADDDDFAIADTYNGGCDGDGSFTPLDPAGLSGQGPAAMGMAETVIGPKWQGTLGTRVIDGQFVSDQDWYTFTPASDGTITVTASSEVPTLVTVVAGDCGGLFNAVTERIGDSNADGNCSATFEAIVLANTTHSIVVEVAPDVLFLPASGTPAVSGSGVAGYEFQASIGALNTGACFTVEGCTQQTLFDCLDVENGIAFNSGTLCADIAAEFPELCDTDIWAGVTTFENEDATTQVFSDVVEPATTDDTFNGGFCDVNDNVIASPISDGVTVGGETSLWLVDGPTIFDIQTVNIFQRDVDSYEYVHSGGDLTVEITAQFAVQVDILNVSCVNEVLTGTVEAGTIIRDVIDPNSVNECSPATLTADLPAGTYYVRVTNDLDDTTSNLDVGFAEPSRYALTVSSVAACVPCTNVNGVGIVDGQDLVELLGQFGNTGNPGDFSGDVNCTGTVDGQDLVALLGDFGTDPGC